MDFESLKQEVSRIYDSLNALHTEYLRLWQNNVVFTWRWWLELAIFILPWIVWIVVRKKESTHRLLYAGFFIIIVSSYLDMVGVTMDLWSYPTTISPLMPSYLAFDFTALPVATMLTLQFFPKVKPVYKALVYSFAGAFIFEPLMEWAGLVHEEHWSNIYTFPVLVVMYLIANLLATRRQFDYI